MNNKELIVWLFEQVKYENNLYQHVADNINEDDTLRKDSYWIEKLEKHFSRANAFEEVLLKMGYDIDTDGDI